MTTTTTHTPLDVFKIGLTAGKLPFFNKSGIEHLRRITTGMTEFRFDDETSSALGKLSMGGLEHLGPLLPDIRLPLRTCAVSFSIPHARIASEEGSTFMFEDVFPDIETYNREICTFIASQDPEFPLIDFFFVDVDKVSQHAMIFPMIYRFDAHRQLMSPLFWGNLDMHSEAYKDPKSNFGAAYRALSDILFNDGSTEDKPSCLLRAHHVLGSAVAREGHNRASAGTMADILCKTGLFLTKDFDRDWSRDGLASGSRLYAGGARLALAALAMLSMRDVEVLVVDGPKRKPGMIRIANRTTPYWQHSSVRLTVPSVRYLYLVKRHSQKLLRRRHHVIGHWVNRGGDRRCLHTWSDIDLNHKKCTTCGRSRHWRKDFDRGDASLGWVQHDRYNVVSPHKQDTLLEQVKVVLSHRQ